MTLLAFAETASTILNIILAFVVLMFMITIHELGHYTAGKLLKFKINEFAIGMGPKIISKTKANGEVFSLRVLPLGGFCAFAGEDEEGENPHCFNRQATWKRLIVLFSGAFFNFISAIVICIVVFSCFGDAAVSVGRVYDFAPQQNQILQEDDIILQINGKELYIAGDFAYQLQKAGDTFDLLVLRNGQEKLLTGLEKQTFTLFYVSSLSSYYPDRTGEYSLQKNDQIYKINGVLIEGENALQRQLANAPDQLVMVTVISSQNGKEYEFDIYKSVFGEQADNQAVKIQFASSQYKGLGITTSYQHRRTFSFGEAVGRSFPYSFELSFVILRTLGGLFTGAVGLDAVGGPISTIGFTSQVVASGFSNVLSLIVMISINLAIFNLLPVPALDGCRMVFVIIEWIRKKPVNRKIEAYINGVGLILLFAFVILIDLLKL